MTTNDERDNAFPFTMQHQANIPGITLINLLVCTSRCFCDVLVKQGIDKQHNAPVLHIRMCKLDQTYGHGGMLSQRAKKRRT